MARSLATALVLAVLLGVVAASSNAKTEPILVTRDSGTLPSGCTPRETAQLLVRLAGAVTSGNGTALDRLFAIEDPPSGANKPAGLAFRWYSVTEGRVGDRPWRHTVFYDRPPLFPYFAERRRQIAVDMSRSWTGGVGIGYTIRRSADDLPESLVEFASGKGEIDCVAQRIYVWSMGQDESVGGQDESTSFGTGCPLPAGWSPGAAIVACSRSTTADVRMGPNASAFSTDFRVRGESNRLDGRCRPASVTARLRAALSGFNRGRDSEFARQFAMRGLFHPYDITEQELVGRVAIARFVDARYRRGDGWTGTTLRVPGRTETRMFSGVRRKVASYRLGLLLSNPGMALVASSADVVVDCSSGLMHRWTGPPVPAP